ncbi:MAG: FecR domain-containing protein [Dehalococcoidia bacterium]|nr:FecR domain-containing protein [Dehalococcoidia bacterium]
MRKELLPILVVAIVAVSVVVAGSALHWWGHGPSNGEVPEEPSGNETTNPPVTPSTLTMLSITEGNVFVMKAGTDDWIEAQVRMTLEPGDIVKSGNSSSAEITFFDGSTIELEAGTEVEVVSLNISDTGSTTIKLKQAIGNTISRVTKLVDSASCYEVETPACVAVVRGSVMLVNVIADGTTWVTNEEGEIWVIVQGVELRVPEGRKCIIIPGQPPRLVPITGGGGGKGMNPDISIKKMPDSMQAHEGDTVTYTYTVTNPGNVALSNVSVTDDRIEQVTYQSGDSDGDGRLDVNETWIFAANYTVTGDDPSPLVNHAAAAGTDTRSRTIVAWATASVDVLRPDIAISKMADREQAHVGDNITYTYNVTNPGNTPLYDISVSDNLTEEVTYQSGDTDHDNRLDRNETWVFTATYTITAEDESPLVNTATVSGTDALGLPVTDEATASVTITATETASISVQVDTEWQASVFIWDGTNNDWAIDENTGQPVDGSNHTATNTTSCIIAVAGGHYYCVWVEEYQYYTYYHLSAYPEGWDISYYPVPGHEVEAACGLAYAGELYSVRFIVTASIWVQIIDPEPPTASILIWDDTLGQWAIDEYTGWAVNGTNHTTPSTIAVAGGHYYYVWTAVTETWYCDPIEYPDDWLNTYYPPPEGQIPAAYGYAAANYLYSLNFTVPY